MRNGNDRKTCFVAMGFGEKTEYQSTLQRVLNVNRTFEDIIEPAATAAVARPEPWMRASMDRQWQSRRSC